jgi:hypothetical protein
VGVLVCGFVCVYGCVGIVWECGFVCVGVWVCGYSVGVGVCYGWVFW